jgi:hypothetical protein
LTKADGSVLFTYGGEMLEVGDVILLPVGFQVYFMNREVSLGGNPARWSAVETSTVVVGGMRWAL